LDIQNTAERIPYSGYPKEGLVTDGQTEGQTHKDS